MGSRSGDIDPAIIFYMQRELGLSVDEVDKVLNKNSGLLGICGDNDLRTILESKSEKSILALNIMIRRIKKYIGAYSVVLGKVDAVIFTGGIGEHAAKVREMVCEGLNHSIGLKIDLVKNQNIPSGNQAIHSEESKIKLFIIPTNEELEIARQTEYLLFETSLDQ